MAEPAAPAAGPERDGGRDPAVRLARTDEQIAACFAVMAQLREGLADAGELVARVRRQEAAGYRLAYLEEDGAVVACAGYRVHEMLAHGRLLYVDDLVTRADGRSRGFGRRLMAWLAAEGRALGCASLQLDSGVQREDAHRFYEREGMTATALHFRLPLASGEVS